MTTTTTGATIRPRERDAILQALRAGVVPRVGQQHIQVGRAEEVKALLADIDRIADGGSAFRLTIGEYGSGKTFFLHLVRSIAMERTRCRKNVLPDPYSPIANRNAEPPSAMRSMSASSALTSSARPTWMCCCPTRGTTPARSACRMASRSRGRIVAPVVVVVMPASPALRRG